jgi:DNA-binding transcriptional ArsR family regulator
LTDPTRAVTATLDGPVLAALARSGKPLTVGEVAAQTPRGSEVGVRRSLARLVEQGIVRAEMMGRNAVHELNRDHVAADIALKMADLRLELWRRLRQTLGAWNPKPIYGYVFGSAARGDGDSSSDIDLLLVHALFPGDSDPRRRSNGLADRLVGATAEFASDRLTARQASKWGQQVDELHQQVRAWTGNPLQAVEMSALDWADHGRRQSSLWNEIARDGIKVAEPPPSLLATLSVSSS